MFKRGDRVERIGNDYDGMFVGDFYIVAEDQQHFHAVLLEGKEYPYDGVKFKLAPPAMPKGTLGFHTIPAAAPTPAGRKDDSGKLDMTLLDDMPRALAAVVEVMQWAVTKKKPTPYDRGSWLGVHADRYRAAIQRHDRAACEQHSAVKQPPKKHVGPRFEQDDETKLLHLAHVACSAMMALENTLREMERNA